MQKIKNITILGATGSIGKQALQVLSSLKHSFKIKYLTANNNIKLLEEQAMIFQPDGVAIANENSYREFKQSTSYKGEILCGEEGVEQCAANKDNDIVLSSLVGFAGVKPTLASIRQGTTVALANKETLVSAGKLITNEAKKYNVDIIAVDSEHNAILQCLAGEADKDIEKIILTASGGPFWNTPINEFKNIDVSQALKHPNWSMGSKITIDSATMMNKGFEVIEAYWLFNIGINKIDVLVHPQSIVHSMVQFVDGSVKAQLGKPDMRIPISYALTYPERHTYDFPRLDLAEIAKLEFFKPDLEKFTCLRLAYDAIEKGGSAPAVVNAANEIAVAAFLNKDISFIEIPKLIESALENIDILDNPTLDEIYQIDKTTREYAYSQIKSKINN